MKKYLTFILFLLLSVQYVQAQRVLHLKKLDANRKYKFMEDEQLKLKLKDSGEVLKGSWMYAGENKIFLSGREVDLQNIRWVDVSGKEDGIYLLRKGQDLFLIAGLTYLVVSQLNALSMPREYRATGQELSVSAGLVGAGLTCSVLDRTLRKRKVRPGKNFSIYMIE